MSESQAAVIQRVEAEEACKPVFDSHRCKACGICEYMCPRGVIKLKPGNGPILMEPERCTLCGLCEYACPDFAVSVEELHSRPADDEVSE